MKQNNWFDPFFILENLSAEEKLIQKNVRDFSNNVLRPIVVNDNRNHNFNRGLYREFGKLGILGSTVNTQLNKVLGPVLTPVRSVMSNVFVRLFLWLVLLYSCCFSKDMSLFFLISIYFLSSR